MSAKAIDNSNKLFQKFYFVYFCLPMEAERSVFLKPNYPNDDRYENAVFAEKMYQIPQDRAVRIYCDGIYDMFHYGHGRFLSQVKSLFPNVCLVVGVCNDELTMKFKGSLVMKESERYESVRYCRFVDEVIEDAPWVITMDFLNEKKIDYVAHDEAPYAHAGARDLYEHIKKLGRFIPTKRASRISTTGIITRMIKDYDLYVRRQILRGISHKDLNISFLRGKHIRIRNSLESDVRHMKEEFKVALDYWEEVSRRWIRNFKNNFSNGSTFVGKVLEMVKVKANALKVQK